MWSMLSFNRSQESSDTSRRKGVLHLHHYWTINLNSLPFLSPIFCLHCFSEHSTYIILTVQVKQKVLPAHIFHRKSIRTWVVLEETKINLFGRRSRVFIIIFRVNLKVSCQLCWDNMTHLIPSTLTPLTPKTGPLSNLACSLLFKLLLDKDRKWFRRIMKEKQNIEGSLLAELQTRDHQNKVNLKQFLKLRKASSS